MHHCKEHRLKFNLSIGFMVSDNSIIDHNRCETIGIRPECCLGKKYTWFFMISYSSKKTIPICVGIPCVGYCRESFENLSFFAIGDFDRGYLQAPSTNFGYNSQKKEESLRSLNIGFMGQLQCNRCEKVRFYFFKRFPRD